MLKLKYNILLIYMLMFSLFMVLNSNSIYFMWIFMELNLMMFLTLLIFNSNYISVVSMKYYLMSSFSSIIFIYFINLSLINKFDYVNIILNISMLMKLGIIPFHYWFIDMMMNLSWMMCFFLSTFQKIIPFFILLYLYHMKFLFFISLFGGIIGIMLGFNQLLLKKIMAYSSINHMFWMLFSFMMKFNLWMIYFLNYMLINSVLFYMFNKFNLNQISDLYLFMLSNKLNYGYYFFFMLMSLGSIPPFYGFLLKWYMILNMVMWMMNFLLIILIIYSLIFLYFYMRVMYNFMLMNFWSLNVNMNNLNLKNMNFKLIYLLNFLGSLNLLMFIFWFMF